MFLISVLELIPEGIRLVTGKMLWYEIFFYSLLLILLGYMFVIYVDNKIDSESRLYKIGILSMLSLLIHNIPEGLAMALSLVGSKMNTYKIILLTIIAGIPMGIGSFIGAYFGGVFHSLIGVFIALAAGTMMYVVLEEIFPKSRSLYCIIGFLVGTIIVYYI